MKFKTELVVVKITPREKAILKEMAEKAQMSMSEYVRKECLKNAE